METSVARFRRLEADKIIETVKALHDRIEERLRVWIPNRSTADMG